MVDLTVRSESWPIRGSFTISRGSKTRVDVVVVELSDGDAKGFGECVPYARYGESVSSVIEQVRSLEAELNHGLTPAELQHRITAGAARNALDCAFGICRQRRVESLPGNLPVSPLCGN